MILVFGLITGTLFGIFLQQAEAIRFERQVGAMRLIDMTIVKYMLTTIVVGAIGVYFLRDMGLVEFAPRAFSLGLQVIGGLLFGAGWAIIGYCPGTSIGALGEGRIGAIWPILGMLLGGLIYAFLYPAVQQYIAPIGALGRVSIADVLGVSHWVVIAVMVVGSVALFRFFERKGL
ncbi:MAG: YeeE/YedE family protein [Spirochaeta sp.]|nr:YeeE/YedE family protein [Spirochaeta sp.]